MIRKSIFFRRAAKHNQWLLGLSIIYIIWNYIQPLLVVLFNSSLITNFGRFVGFFIAIQIIVNADIRFLLFNKKEFIIYFCFFTSIVLISTLFSSNYDLHTTGKKIYNIGSVLIVYIVFMYLSFHEKNIKILLWSFAILAVLNSVIGIWGALTGKSLLAISREMVGVGTFGFDPTSGRSGGLRGENYVGMWNAVALSFGFLLLTNKKHFFKIIGIAFICLSSLAIIVSLSRTAVICGVTVIIISFILILNKRKLVHLIIFCIVLLMIFQFSQLLLLKEMEYFTPYTARITKMRWQLSNILDNERKYIWIDYIRASLETPVWGKGSGYINQEVSKGQYVPHNSFLDIFVEHGFAGLFLYIIPFILAFRSFIYFKNRRNQDPYGNVLCATFWGMAVGLLTLSNPFFKLLWMIAGSLEGRTILKKQKLFNL